MSIREVRPADREEWLRMLAGLYDHYVPEEFVPYVDEFLEGRTGTRPPLVAAFVSEREGGGLRGFLELSLREYAEGCDGETPYVESWYVDPDSRRAGIGRRLMRAAEAWAREHGHAELASDTTIDNTLSESAHRAYGFEVVERTIHFRKAL